MRDVLTTRAVGENLHTENSLEKYCPNGFRKAVLAPFPGQTPFGTHIVEALIADICCVIRPACFWICPETTTCPKLAPVGKDSVLDPFPYLFWFLHASTLILLDLQSPLFGKFGDSWSKCVCQIQATTFLLKPLSRSLAATFVEYR